MRIPRSTWLVAHIRLKDNLEYFMIFNIKRLSHSMVKTLSLSQMLVVTSCYIMLIILKTCYTIIIVFTIEMFNNINYTLDSYLLTNIPLNNSDTVRQYINVKYNHYESVILLKYVIIVIIIWRVP